MQRWVWAVAGILIVLVPILLFQKHGKTWDATWARTRQLTYDSKYNHTYARRPVNAHPDFQAFWADGHGRALSPSRLYFCNKVGEVFAMPVTMKSPTARPHLVGRE